jgi:hypothetical protein
MNTRTLSRSSTILGLAAAAGIAVTSAQAAPITGIVQVTTTGEINVIDTATGIATQIYNDPNAGVAFNGAAYDPDNGLVYLQEANSNTLYSFNPQNPGAGLTELGTYDGVFFAAGFQNGIYYAIETGTSHQLLGFDLSSAGGGVLAPISSETLNISGTGLGPNFGGGDLDFNNGALYLTVVSAGGTSALFRYDSLAAIGAPPSAVSTGEFSNGIAFDPDGALFGYSTISDSFYEIDPNDLTIGTVINNSDPAFQAGGDLTTAFVIDLPPTEVPEPASLTLMLSSIAGLAVFARLRRKTASVKS